MVGLLCTLIGYNQRVGTYQFSLYPENPSIAAKLYVAAKYTLVHSNRRHFLGMGQIGHFKDSVDSLANKSNNVPFVPKYGTICAHELISLSLVTYLMICFLDYPEERVQILADERWGVEKPHRGEKS